jgi:vitamin B12 transporter
MLSHVSFQEASASVLALGVALACSQSMAQGVTLSPLVVTASRSAVPLTELLADVTVIGAEEIARAGPGGLAALLQRQPGVEIVANGGPGSTSGVFLRGANTGQTLVLLDGLRIGSSTSGTAPLEAIPLEQIERIEILRGPASSLYGADAIGGVIQIFTRSARDGFAANAQAGDGTYGTTIASAGISGASGPWRYVLEVGRRQSEGFNAIANPANFSFDPDRDGYRDDHAGGSVGFRFAPEQELSARFLRSRLNAQFDAGDAFDDRTVTVMESYQIESRNRLTSFWTSRLQAGWVDEDSDSKTGFGPSRFRTRQRLYGWQNDIALPLGTLAAAVERREERVDTDAGFAVNERNTNALTGVYQVRVGAHSAQASLRRDDSSQFGARSTGSVAYGYAFEGGVRVTSSYGTAFKPPTFNDLYFPSFSNPELKPESAHNADLAIRYAKAEVSGGVVAYRNKVHDLIVFQCDADFNCAPQNVADATLQGLTFDLAARVGDMSAKASLDLQNPRDDTTDRVLPRRARRHAAASLGYSLGPLRMTAELTAASERFDDAANTRRMGGYALLNLAAQYPLAPRWTFFARLDNALDKRYELAADFNTARASVFAGVRFQN